MKTLYVELQTKTVREELPSNTTYYQYEVPYVVRPFIEMMFKRATLNGGYWNYNPEDIRRLELISKRFEKHPNGFCNHSIDVPEKLAQTVANLVSEHGLRVVLHALALENEARAFMADSDVKSRLGQDLAEACQMAERLVKTAVENI